MTGLRVAMIGCGFMGAAHSQGWRTAHRAFRLPLAPEMSVVVGRRPEAAAEAAAQWGWADSATDWRAVLDRPDIDVVDIVTPGDTHAEIAVAALEAGKHVLCEKPLANSVAEAATMAAAAERAAERGVRSMVGFTTAECRQRLSPGSSWPTAGSARSNRCAPATGRTGWWTRRHR